MNKSSNTTTVNYNAYPVTAEEAYRAGMLTGDEIINRINKGDITISPFDEKKVNPNSYNFTLHPELLIYKDIYLDMHREPRIEKLVIPEEGFVLMPGELYIGRTVERTFTNKFIPMLNGRSSGGRLGISVHICAGFGDIGFDGTWTLEITVVKPVRVYPHEDIAQICYFTPCGSTDIQYNGRYMGQIDATASRFWKG